MVMTVLHVEREAEGMIQWNHGRTILADIVALGFLPS